MNTNEVGRAHIGELSPERLASFAKEQMAPVIGASSDLVEIEMDSGYQVVDVRIRVTGLAEADDVRRVESALVEAFNDAVQQMLRRNAERFAALQDRPEAP
jgi:DNA-binding protein YbaB